MWPFNKSLSSTVAPEDDLTEAQIAKFFADAAPKPAYKDITVTSTDASGAQVTRIERVAEALPHKEEACNLQYYFDEFFMCYTPKSQLRNWYRYGEKKDCAERWRDFKWCMTTRMADEETSQSMLAQRKVDLSQKVHKGPNTEDIWTLRETPLNDPWSGSEDSKGMSIS